ESLVPLSLLETFIPHDRAVALCLMERRASSPARRPNAPSTVRKDGVLVACLAVHLPVTSGGYRGSVLSGRVSRSKREARGHAFFRGRTGKIIPMSTLPLPIAAFVAGLISFLSPCVLPLVPGYVSLISGAGVEELRQQDGKLMRSVMLNSVMFILGFSLVFMVLGA